jgi:hypothetical protein
LGQTMSIQEGTYRLLPVKIAPTFWREWILGFRIPQYQKNLVYAYVHQ